MQASVMEVFSSRQGEGVCVGDPQIFVRFGGCNLVCDYCDTPESIPSHSGTRVGVDDLLSRIDDLRKDRPADIALTGGEPLMQVAFLQDLIPGLNARGCRVYLETNGSLPQALAQVVDQCDRVAMDFKLKSSIRRDLWEAHRWFLETAGNKVFVKMVLTDQTAEEEFQRGVELIASVRPETPLVLQPATPWGSARSIPLARLTSWWGWAIQRLPDVRIIPQVHRLWGIA